MEVVKKNRDLEKASIIHIYICKKLSDTFDIRNPIPYRNLIYQITKMTYHLPRKYDNIIIKELIELGFIKKISEGRSPLFILSKKNYDSLIEDINKVDQSTQRVKILKSKYKKLLEEIEKKESSNQKYELIKEDFEKLLRKKELKSLEGYHYW